MQRTSWPQKNNGYMLRGPAVQRRSGAGAATALCGSMRGSLRPQKSHPSSHHELHGSLFRLLPSSRLNRCDSGYVAAAHLHKRTRDLHPSKVLSRPSVECSLAGAHSSSSQCEPAQAWEVDMCASKHHLIVGTCMPRLASKFRWGARCMLASMLRHAAIRHPSQNRGVTHRHADRRRGAHSTCHTYQPPMLAQACTAN